MAVNIMEILKKMQRDLADQKEYMRSLHAINRNLNEKINLMEEKNTQLPKILVSIERLEQQVKKNNIVLFGNDEIENFEDKTIMMCKPALCDEEKVNNTIAPTETYVGETEINHLHSPVIDLINTERDCEKDSITNNLNKRNEEQRAEELKNEIREIKQMIKDFTLIRQTSVEDAAMCIFSKHQFNNLEDKLNKITGLYQSDMTDLRKLINDSLATSKSLVNEVTSIRKEKTDFSSEQLNHLSAELKVMKDMNRSEKEDIKEIMKDFVAASKTSIDSKSLVYKENEEQLYKICIELKRIEETNQADIGEIKGLIKNLAKVLDVKEAANTVGKQKTVQISPTYFSAVQISKLNSELRRIAEVYQETNMCPIIEVIPGPAEYHSVMELLSEGVFYNSRDNKKIYKIKLGTNGFQRSDVLDMITHYPDLTVNEVVKEYLVSKNKWDEWSKTCSFINPMAYRYGALRPVS